MVIHPDRTSRGPFTQASELTGNVALLLLDARCERRMIDHNNGIIVSEKSWKEIDTWVKLLHQQPTYPSELSGPAASPSLNNNISG